MATPYQKSFHSQIDDDDDDAAFHSADEGEDDVQVDQKLREQREIDVKIGQKRHERRDDDVRSDQVLQEKREDDVLHKKRDNDVLDGKKEDDVQIDWKFHDEKDDDDQYDQEANDDDWGWGADLDDARHHQMLRADTQKPTLVATKDQPGDSDDELSLEEETTATRRPAAPPTQPVLAQNKNEPIDEPPKTTAGADGWDFDDWDAVGDEGSGKHSGSDSEDVMKTPLSEKQFPVSARRNERIVEEQQQKDTKRTIVQKSSQEVQGMNAQQQRQDPQFGTRMPRRDNVQFGGQVQVVQVGGQVPRQDQIGAQKPSSLWGGWGHQLLSLATDSINTLTNSVGEGLTSVLETMETTIGAPTPEELAKLSLQERAALLKKADEVKEPAPIGEKDDCDSASEEVSSEGGSDAAARSDKEDALSSGYQSDTVLQQQDRKDQGITSLFSGMTNLIENTGKTLVSGSLDVLETLGKKTFETVTDASADGQRRRLKIPIPADRSGQHSLSQVLKELKEKAEDEAKLKQQEHEARKCNYAALFEDAQGLVHLEALELLSSSCCQQTRSLMELLSPDQIEEVASSMENLQSLFDAATGVETFGEDVEEINFEYAVNRDLIFTSVVPDRLLSLDFKARSWIASLIERRNNGEEMNIKTVYEECLLTLATFTAACVDTYHKIAQQILVPSTSPVKAKIFGDDRSVRMLASFTRTLCNELASFSSKFTTVLGGSNDLSQEPDAVNRMLTATFYEASNSAGYVQEAFKMIMPIVQLANIRERLR